MSSHPEVTTESFRVQMSFELKHLVFFTIMVFGVLGHSVLICLKPNKSVILL